MTEKNKKDNGEEVSSTPLTKKTKDLLTEDPDFGWNKQKQKEKGLDIKKQHSDKKITTENLKR